MLEEIPSLYTGRKDKVDEKEAIAAAREYLKPFAKVRTVSARKPDGRWYWLVKMDVGIHISKMIELQVDEHTRQVIHAR